MNDTIVLPILIEEEKSQTNNLTEILPQISPGYFNKFESPSVLPGYKVKQLTLQIENNMSPKDYLHQEEEFIKKQRPILTLKNIIHDQIQKKRDLNSINGANDILSGLYRRDISPLYERSDSVTSDLVFNSKRNRSLNTNVKVVSKTNHHLFRPKVENTNKFLNKLCSN